MHFLGVEFSSFVCYITLENLIKRGNFKSHSKNGKDAIRKEL